jgi:hypothetical protein
VQPVSNYENSEIQFQLYDDEIHVKKFNDFLSQNTQNILVLRTSIDEAQIALTKLHQILEFLGYDLKKILICIQGNSSKESMEIGLKNFAESPEKLCLYQLEKQNFDRFGSETDDSKKMILLVSDDNLYQTLKCFENFQNCQEFKFKNFLVEHLTFDCKDKLLEKQINLQGCFVSLIDVISQSDVNDLKLANLFQEELQAFEIPPGENSFHLDRKLKQPDIHAQYNEIEFLNFVDKFAIVSDQPGAGKSELFRYLAKLCKKDFPFSLVFKIDLNSPALKLDELQDLNLDSSDFDEFVLKNIIGAKSQLESSIFKYFVEYKKKIHLFLDGFDEISPHYKETVLKMVKHFIKIKSVKLFVSTRPELALYLQNEFNEISFCLEPMTKAESKEFLLAICEDSQHINDFLERLPQDPELIGNPLILTMVAEILNDKDYGLNQFQNDWPILKKYIKALTR